MKYQQTPLGNPIYFICSDKAATRRMIYRLFGLVNF